MNWSLWFEEITDSIETASSLVMTIHTAMLYDNMAKDSHDYVGSMDILWDIMRRLKERAAAFEAAVEADEEDPHD